MVKTRNGIIYQYMIWRVPSRSPLQPKKEITFHPHKQRYKPSYTLIPLASSGYYDISQNDLVNLADLGTEAKKNINLPVLNDTRAMSNLSNFKITL